MDTSSSAPPWPRHSAAAVADAALIDGHEEILDAIEPTSDAAVADAALIDGHTSISWSTSRSTLPRWPTRP